jgi:hypothetical protein
MKPFLTAAFLLTLISCGGGTTTPTPTPAAPLEVAKTAVGTLIGTPVTQAIGASGGNASVVSAGAKIIIPAGAMPDGSSISVQAISNTLAGAGQGIRLSGSDWTQPITLQFSYPASITDPENQMIAVQNPDGSWVSSNRVKVDAVNRTISMRLAPDASSILTKGLNTSSLNASGLTATASTSSRDILWTKKFFLKPDTASVKLGESVSFTAYAKEARTRGETKLSPDDLDLLDRVYVLKTKVDDLSFEVFEDFAYPLTTVVKDYPFTNTKEGYTRAWTVTAGPGSIAPSGATSGKFTAPTDPSAAGKTATITFISTKDGTSNIARASASVNIEGNKPFARYEGYIEGEYNITEGGDSLRMTFSGKIAYKLREPAEAQNPIYDADLASSDLTIYSFSDATIVGTCTLGAETKAITLLIGQLNIFGATNQYTLVGQMQGQGTGTCTNKTGQQALFPGGQFFTFGLGQLTPRPLPNRSRIEAFRLVTTNGPSTSTLTFDLKGMN